ncbi:hypothetical protein ABPG77_010154 [Micractinium sp. CCAP 211/92]
MDAQHPFVLAPLDTLYRLSYDLDDAVRAAPGGPAAVAQQQVVDAICALLSLCSGRIVGAHEVLVQEIFELSAEEKLDLTSKFRKLVGLKVEVAKISGEVDQLEALTGLRRLGWLLLGGGLLALPLEWLWKPAFSADLRFDTTIMQWQVAALAAACTQGDVPTWLLLAAAVLVGRNVSSLPSRFKNDVSERGATLQALSSKAAQALQLAGELQSCSILQGAADAVAAAAHDTLRRLHLLE